MPTPIEVVESDPAWPARFDELAARIRGVLGARVLGLEHVGSTSVPDLPAKPIIDIDLTVADSRDEASYVPALEGVGLTFVLRERDLARAPASSWLPMPRANLHVWSPGCPEAVRHRLFRDWLREHPDDRARYAEVKRSSASSSNAAGETVMDYNRRKQPVGPRDPRPHVPGPRDAAVSSARRRTLAAA